ncbi:MAG: hypothetical protein EOP45_06075 [Sphingobacteriaceae bacterium]|nr:MAG: hypothetical protein EOP45_06075 [Sphingobacteriaceae bacterium]
MQELLDDIKALRRGIEALNKRSLEQGQPISRAEVNEVLAKVAKGTTFTIDYKGVAANIQPHLATPDTIAAAITTGTQQLAQVIGKIPPSVPVEGKVWGFTNWQAGLICMLTPLLLVLASFYSVGVFDSVPIIEYETQRAANQKLINERDFYQRQIQQFTKEMNADKESRKAAQHYFPKYIPSSSPKGE